MREIRFRFWDAKEGGWLGKDSSYWKELTFEDCRNKLIASMRQGNIVAEQYTGLKDKNGKEVYEGDIISFENEKGLARVLWLGGKAMFGLRWLDCGVEDELDYWNVCMGPTEVIGNVHEDEELLEEKKNGDKN